MTLKPATLENLSNLLANANQEGRKIELFDLSALNRVLDHKSEDMTAKVQAGATLAVFQQELGKRGQWLPLDPRNPERINIGSLLAEDVSGPRRFGYGTVRDYVIGLTAVLADGRVIHSGGNVVKNVAGYDLMKLFIGSQNSLGVIVEVIFKLRPLPERETFVEAECTSIDAADRLIESVLSSALTPIVLDLHNLNEPKFHLVLGFAGTKEELEWQLSKAAELGIKNPSSLDYENNPAFRADVIHTTSVLPSKLGEVLRSLDRTPFMARAGNGIVFHLPVSSGSRNGNSSSPGVRKLAERLKAEFDPKRIFPDISSSSTATLP